MENKTLSFSFFKKMFKLFSPVCLVYFIIPTIANTNDVYSYINSNSPEVADSIRISGFVRDAGNNDPLDNIQINVTVLNNSTFNLSTATDQLGYYELKQLLTSTGFTDELHHDIHIEYRDNRFVFTISAKSGAKRSPIPF